MKLMTFDNLSRYSEIKAFVATREVGNVSFSASDNEEETIANRKAVSSLLEIKLEEWTVAGLIHGDKVSVINKDMKGMGSVSKENVIENTDAMVTNEKGILLMVPVADCVPILFFDPRQTAIGIAHAGWRGTLKEIAEKTVYKMQSEFRSDPKDLIVGIGPCICVKHYEVDEAVIPNAKGNLNLRMANIIQLVEMGVRKENIEIMDYCTYDRTDLFYSHRAEGKTGRFATGILIK